MLTFLILLTGNLYKGPPDAVIKKCSTLLIEKLFKANHNEKCSESTGIKSVLFFFNSFLIKFHPQIIDSLFAIVIILVNLIN